MIVVENLHPVVREMLAVHEAFRKLGFESDDIFVMLDDPDGHAKVILRAQGKQFIVRMDGEWHASVKDRMKAWEKAVEAWNGTMTDDDRQEIWQGSHIVENTAAFVIMLDSKGFVFPVGTKKIATKKGLPS
jgi:hypothetical protein